jgi:hypothetical protein
MLIHDSRVSFGDHEDGLLVKRAQEIPEEFLDDLKDRRFASQGRPEGDFMHVASIPVVVVEKWLREGFDVFKEPYREILKRLHNEHLDAFIATDKRV